MESMAEVQALGWRMNLANEYGCKRGYIRHHVYRSVQLAGGLRQFSKIDWRLVRRLVFVCHGNICRSAYAEGRARALGLAAASFGLEAGGSSPANPVAVKIGRACGIDLSGHRSHKAEQVEMTAEDLLVGMEPVQGRRLRQFARSSGAQVTLLGLWSVPPRPHLEDPYGLSEEYFTTCFAVIDSAVESIASRISEGQAG
jgi:protein-tyrosine phosphatase